MRLTEARMLQHGDGRQIELRPATTEGEVSRCWICFEEESNIDPLSDPRWRKPCACSLIAHEECLLTWLDETQRQTSQGVNSAGSIRCPQCKQVYQISSRRSHVVRWLTFGDRWITRALLATIPLGLLKSIAVVCFYYGQGAMGDVLGEDKLMDIIVNLKPGDEARYLIGTSVIPFCLIGSRFDIFNFVLPLVPSIVCFSDASFIQARRPMESSPTLWLCILPWLRNIYSLGWRMAFGRLESQWKHEAGLVKDNQREVAPGIVIRDAPGRDQARPVEGAGPRQRAGENNNADGNIEANGDVRAQANNQVQVDDEDAVAERWVYIEAPKFARLIAGALILPKIAVFSGNLLTRLPGFRQRYPHRFQRVLLGGVAFVVAKDFLNLFFLYARAKGRATRHIANAPQKARSAR